MRECWLCGRNGFTDPLEVHHIFGSDRKKKSEKYGLLVDLCGNRCHRLGEFAVHNNAQTMQQLHEYGQKKAMEEQGWTIEEFRKEFGKNYLDIKEETQ